MAVWSIACVVVAVIGFTVAQGWKLGVIEAVIYVMVVGMAVDYVVHLSEAYLESHERSRTGRTVDMLTTMGISVLSGAASTLGATFFLFFPQIIFFVKFGQVIFFLISMRYDSTFFAILRIQNP